MVDQLQRVARVASSTPTGQAERMRFWRVDVLAAEVKKTESTGDETQLVPNLSSRIRSITWSH